VITTSFDWREGVYTPELAPRYLHFASARILNNISINPACKRLLHTNNHEEKQQLVKTLLEKDRGIQMANTVLYQVTQDNYDRALIFERNKI